LSLAPSFILRVQIPATRTLPSGMASTYPPHSPTPLNNELALVVLPRATKYVTVWPFPTSIVSADCVTFDQFPLQLSAQEELHHTSINDTAAHQCGNLAEVIDPPNGMFEVAYGVPGFVTATPL